MALLTLAFSFLLALIGLAAAQTQTGWGQCGGQGWTGATTCTSGYTCSVINAYYQQCIPGLPTTATTTTTPNPTQVTVTVTDPSATTTVTGTTTSWTTVTSSCPPPPPTSTYTVTSCTPTSTTTSATPTPTVTGLHNLAKAKGLLYFGSATDNGELSDAPYVAILSDTSEFGQITPGNSQKWDATEPLRGNFQFARSDVIVDFAQGNGQLIRGHTCVWHSQLPSWVSNGNFDSLTLTSIVDTHCRTVVGNYAGEITANLTHPDAWDVVNEPFNEDGTFRNSVFYSSLNTSYIETALRAARAADPNAKLYINDYNIEGTGSKSTGMFNLIRSLKQDGVPIDGIGIQGHLISGAVPNTIQQNIEQFVALDVEVAITELDIRITLPVSDPKLQQQKVDYQKVVTACKNVPGCIGITIWDYTDKYSWVPSVFEGQGAALAWDENLNKKPAYDGIVAALTS